LTIKGEDYPGLVRSNGVVRGIIRHEVSEGDLAKLDAFEAACYRRVSETAKTASGSDIPVEVYVVRDDYRHVLGDSEWDPAMFAQTGLERFMSSYSGFRADDH
jgi:gamma-glutamylcyclotransferase (GGCT)/AIG2-like uncharacterized protein YtfP